MRRTLLFVFGGLLLGGIMHVAIVFMVPLFADNDAWAQMHRFGADEQFHLLPVPAPGDEPLASLDPRMAQAVCRFSLAGGPLRVTADLPDDFWSVAVFDRRGRNVYSLNDRAADREKLDLVILTSVQMAQLQQNPPASLDTLLVVPLTIDEGFVLLRVFVPDESVRQMAIDALASAACGGSL